MNNIQEALANGECELGYTTKIQGHTEGVKPIFEFGFIHCFVVGYNNGIMIDEFQTISKELFEAEDKDKYFASLDLIEENPEYKRYPCDIMGNPILTSSTIKTNLKVS